MPIAAVNPLPPMLALFDMLGGSEIFVVFLLILLLFGGEKMPEFARGLGKVIREFRKAASGVEQEFKRALEEEPARPPQPTYPNSSANTIMPPPPAAPAGTTEYSPAPSPTPAAPVPPPPPPAEQHPDLPDERDGR